MIQLYLRGFRKAIPSVTNRNRGQNGHNIHSFQSTIYSSMVRAFHGKSSPYRSPTRVTLAKRSFPASISLAKICFLAAGIYPSFRPFASLTTMAYSSYSFFGSRLCLYTLYTNIIPFANFLSPSSAGAKATS